MDFQDWLDAFERALKAAGSGFSAAMYSQADLQAAWSSGFSPVIAARQAMAGQFNMAGAMFGTPMVAIPARSRINFPVPYPNRKMLGFLHLLFKIAAYLIWIAGAFLVVMYILVSLGAFGAEVASNRRDANPGAIAIISAMGFFYVAALAFVMLVAGAIWMFLSELICLLTGIHDRP